MSELGPVGIGLSVAFAAFMVVLGLEIYYIWMSRQRRLVAGAGRRSRSRRARCVEEAEAAPAIAVEDADVVQKRWAEMLGTLEKGRNWLFVEYRRAACLAKQLMASKDVATAAAPPVAESRAGTPAAGELSGCCEEGDEEDIFKLVGLWGGPSRLLFTITEETKEEMEIEDAKSAKGKSNSRRGSRASSELILVQSAATSPFHTPPSSPPFATPFGSPDPTLVSASAHPSKASLESTSSSSSTTSSSPQHHRRPLSALFEETSSFTSSSATTSSAATPATLSPPPAPPLPCSLSASPKRHRRTLGLLFDPPPSPSSALYNFQHQNHLYHQRVHPHPLSPPGFRCHSIEANPCLSAAKLDPLPPRSPASQSPPILRPPPTFSIPDPPQPTTPCPFRPSSALKLNGFLAYPSAP